MRTGRIAVHCEVSSLNLILAPHLLPPGPSFPVFFSRCLQPGDILKSRSGDEFKASCTYYGNIRTHRIHMRSCTVARKGIPKGASGKKIHSFERFGNVSLIPLVDSSHHLRHSLAFRPWRSPVTICPPRKGENESITFTSSVSSMSPLSLLLSLSLHHSLMADVPMIHTDSDYGIAHASCQSCAKANDFDLRICLASCFTCLSGFQRPQS